MFSLFKRKQKPQKLLIVLGTDFGSYQFNQLVDTSDEYQVVGFISDDPWQRKSSFGKVGVFYSSEIKGLCDKHGVAAVILPSDQKEAWLDEKSNDSEDDSAEDPENERNVLAGLEAMVKHCDILTIRSELSTEEANRFLSDLISG